MNLSKFRFTLDLHSIQSQASIPVMVGDTSVTLIISITDGGLPYHIEDGCIAKISIKRPTGTHLEEFCVVKNNAVVEYAFSQNENTCAVPGVHVCDIILYGADGGVVGTPRFTMVVSERVIRFDDIVLTDEDFTAVDAMVKQEVTRQAQEATRQSQEATRQEQERLRVIAENSREEAEAARTDDYKEAVQAAADAKAEADRAKKYVENFDAGLYTEKDPTVPAWAKKENPPTPAEVGAAPADIYIEADPSTTGWYKVGTFGVKMSSANISIAFGGTYNVVRPNAHEINIIRTASTNYIYNRTANQPNHCIGKVATKGVTVYAYFGNSSGNANKIYASVHVTHGSFTSAGFVPADVTDGDMDCICYLNEYENPPMELGVEYRTTERYLGKPVYTKVMDVGTMPNASKKTVDVFAENCTLASFDVALYSTSSSGGRIVIPRISASHYFNESLGTFTIETTEDSSKYTARITMKYTKP